MDKKAVSNYNREYYQRNRERNNERRRARYQSDPEHRAKLAGIAAEKWRAKAKAKAKVRPSAYVYDLQGAAEQLGISFWTLREWKQKNYFPQPAVFNGKMWVTQNQLLLLSKLKEAMARSGRSTRQERVDLAIAMVYCNWTVE